MLFGHHIAHCGRLIWSHHHQHYHPGMKQVDKEAAGAFTSGTKKSVSITLIDFTYYSSLHRRGQSDWLSFAFATRFELLDAGQHIMPSDSITYSGAPSTTSSYEFYLQALNITRKDPRIEVLEFRSFLPYNCVFKTWWKRGFLMFCMWNVSWYMIYFKMHDWGLEKNTCNWSKIGGYM